MHAFAFEVYVLSLLFLSKYHAFASDLKAEKLSESVVHEQTTDPKDAEGKQEMPNMDDLTIKGKINPLEHYKKLFSEHRASQLNAVKAMQKFGNPEAQYKLVNLMLNQLFKNIHEASQNLTQWGFLPGDEFPQNETIRESMSKVLENTALFGDMLLRMPNTVHEFYDKNREWHMVMNWAYMFSNQSGVFEGPHQILLNLMGQEAGLIPKSPNYVNPFLAMEEEGKAAVPVDAVSKKKKEKKAKKIPRGPRMSRTEL